MGRRLSTFLSHYSAQPEADKALSLFRRKHNASPIGASAAEIAVWAKKLVAKREAKKGRGAHHRD